ncbi:MAG TPA: LysR substrate-binding domain-containing protein [Beijerinckiaceae bacterium]|nr:LysR substrate-binding domain-containing protein [Beijerinckiaceae bacterium]
MMSNLSRQLDAFRAVMLTGGMTAAAQTLFITQPAVSRLIKDLEHDFGLRLFERHGNQIAATAEARRLFEEVERTYSGLSHLRAFADDLRGSRVGSLRIAALPALAIAFLPFCLARFRNQRPNLSIMLDGIPSHLVLERVASGLFDIGFAAVPAERPSLRLTPVPGSLMVVMPAGHRLAGRTVLRAKDIAGESVIMLGRGSYLRHSIETALAQVHVETQIESPLAAIACAFVAQGLGITLVDPFTAADFLGRGVVARRFEPAIDVGYSLITSKDRPLSQVANDFVASLGEATAAYLEEAQSR